VVSEWYTGRFSYQTGPVTPKIAVYRPVYREKVNPANKSKHILFSFSKNILMF
jgi:hypothetical protein